MAKTTPKKAKRSVKTAKADAPRPAKRTRKASRVKTQAKAPARPKTKTKAKAKPTGGRPKGSSKWDGDGRLCAAVEASAAAGGTPEEFSTLLGVDVRTVYRWLNAEGPDFKPDLRAAVERGRQQASDRVERSLFQRAVGFATTETHTTVDDEGERTRTVEKTVLGDVAAQKYWLQNRRGEAWRDRQEIEGNLTVTLPEITITKTYRAPQGETEPHEHDDDSGQSE